MRSNDDGGSGNTIHVLHNTQGATTPNRRLHEGWGPWVRALALFLSSWIAACHPTRPQPTVATADGSPVQVADLSAEGLRAPLGLGTTRPRLGWKLKATRRGVIQTAFRIVVASSPEVLARDEGDLWDSGRIESAEQTQIAYAGRPLRARERVVWKVRVWDGEGKASSWSAPASWEMGLLEAADWSGRWIGSPEDETVAQRPVDLSAAKWIWHPDPADPHFPVGRRRMRVELELPRNRRLVKATLFAGVNDSATVRLNGQDAMVLRMTRPPDVVDVTRLLRPGRNAWTVEAENEGGAAGVIGRLDLSFAAGPPMIVHTDESWRSERGSTDDDRRWLQAGYDDRSWSAVRVVAGFGQPPLAHLPARTTFPPPAPHLRKAFTLDGDVARARVHVAGLGYHELHINGRRVGDHVLDPSFTDYAKRVEVVTHDVTSLLRAGANAVGVILGNGMYRQHDQDSWDFHAAPWRDRLRLLLQLEVTYVDGRTARIVSDASWRVTTGPIVYDGTRHGESYDARLERADWAMPTADEQGFRSVVELAPPRGRLVAQEHPPIRVVETRRPSSVREPRPGVFVFDVGQNLAGWARIRVRGASGTKITLRYGERLDAQGNVDRGLIDNLIRSARFQLDEYTLAGRADGEQWEPRFAYHGFQYVEVTGWPGTPTLDDLDARVVHTDFASAGAFSSSNETLDRIQAATRWSFRTNFHSIPTDCPHREKNGWAGDAQLAVLAGMFNFDAANAYRKWIGDLLDAQTERGDLPGIAPTSGWGLDAWSGPVWEAALFEIPWALHLFRRDRRILEDVMPAWEKYLAHAFARAKGGLADWGLGDWVPLRTRTPVVVTSTAYLHRMALLAARSARVLGQPERAARFQAQADGLARVYSERLVDANRASVAGDQQTALGVTLFAELATGDLANRLAERLSDGIASQKHHLDTGVLGAKVVLRALASHGQIGTAYSVVANEEFPSWGHWMKQGATTLWEDWEGKASLNHAFFGDVSAWMFENLAGIQPDPRDPGFHHVVLSPYVPATLASAEGRYESPYGTIESAWRKDGAGVRYSFTVPPNSRATITLPGADPEAVLLEGGVPASQAPGVTRLASPPGAARFAVGSGRYELYASARASSPRSVAE